MAVTGRDLSQELFGPPPPVTVLPGAASPAPAPPGAPAPAPGRDLTQDLFGPAPQSPPVPESAKRQLATTTPTQLSAQAEASAGTPTEKADAEALIAFEADWRTRAGRPETQRAEYDPTGDIARAKGVAAAGISTVASAVGTAGGAALGGPAGALAGDVALSYGARQLNLALGLEEPSPLGDALAAGIPVAARLPQLALRSLQWVLRATRGGKQLKHLAMARAADERLAQTTLGAEETAARGMQAAEELAATARVPLQAARKEADELVTDVGFKSREVRAVRQGAFAAAKSQIGRKAADLKDLASRAMGGTKSRLAATSGTEVEHLVRTAGRWGPDVSDEAVTLAYRQLDDVQHLPVPSQALDRALGEIPAPVRQGLSEVLSGLPGTGEVMTFARLRQVQSQIGRQIRGLERTVRRGGDVNAEPRLDALKKLYASTFDVLETAEHAGGSLPAGTRAALESANALNRTVSMMERIDTLREMRGTRMIDGEAVFDAAGLLRGIRDDPFLVRMLRQADAYDGLVASLGRMARAQRGRLPTPRVDTSDITTIQQQMSRQDTLRQVRLGRAHETLKRSVDTDLGTIDEQLAAARADVQARQAGTMTQATTRYADDQAQIANAAPAQNPGPLAGGPWVRPALVVLGAMQVNRPGLGVVLGTVIGGLQGIGGYLLRPGGQQMLENLFALDPRLTYSKLALLAQGARSIAYQPPIPEELP